MEQLICKTAAYKIYCGDEASGRLSHAYMLYFGDGANMRAALKLFAMRFFCAERDGRAQKLILSEGLPDLKIYPLPDKKLTVEAATAIVDDAVLKPLEGDRKLYIISEFESASAIFQNKLLKILEEPPEGVYFILGATSPASVLDTVKSRVKALEIPPFSPEEIYGALQRKGSNPLNRAAAFACGGVLGAAEDMVRGDWYKEVRGAALEICGAATVAEAVKVSAKYGETKYKKELLSEMQRVYFAELKKYAEDHNYKGKLTAGAVTHALSRINGAFADVKFNANFSSLLYDFTLRVAKENMR